MGSFHTHPPSFLSAFTPPSFHPSNMPHSVPVPQGLCTCFSGSLNGSPKTHITNARSITISKSLIPLLSQAPPFQALTDEHKGKNTLYLICGHLRCYICWFMSAFHTLLCGPGETQGPCLLQAALVSPRTPPSIAPATWQHSGNLC